MNWESQLLSSQNPNNANNDIPSNNDSENDLLLPALRRQTRYWIPLLLSWLKGNGSNDEYDNSLDLPLTSKQRRQQRNKNSNPSSSNSPPEVQIEALRALTALTEWTAREN